MPTESNPTYTTESPDSMILIGKMVRIEDEQTGALVRVGEVECATESGDLLWIKAFGLEMRAMYGPALGHSVFPNFT